jgi:hypothetical protein
MSSLESSVIPPLRQAAHDLVLVLIVCGVTISVDVPLVDGTDRA